MRMKQETVERAQLPWYRRSSPWWLTITVALVLVVAAVVLQWPFWVLFAAAALCGVVIMAVDGLLAKHIRQKHPIPEPQRWGEPDPQWQAMQQRKRSLSPQ